MVAGIDVGSSEHWVCSPVCGDDGKPVIRSFGTTTVDLEALVDWLAAQGTKSAAMESTYVYWIPLYELLESRGIEPVLVNARQLHNVPGRKNERQRLPVAPAAALLRPPPRLVPPERGDLTAPRAAAPDGEPRR